MFTEALFTTSKKWKPVFTAALFKIGKKWKESSCPSADEWTKCGLYIQWNIGFVLKELDTAEQLSTIAVLHCMYKPHFVYPFICRRTIGFFPFFAHFE